MNVTHSLRKPQRWSAFAALILSVLAFALLPATPVRAALFGDDEARKAILELRDNLAEANRQRDEKFDALNKRIDELENRINAVQHGQSESADKNDAAGQEMAKLRGATEQLANDVATLQKRDHDLYNDLDLRMRKLEPTSVTVDGHSGAVDHDEQAAYDSAMSQFRSNDFRSSINAFNAFVSRYPQSVYTPVAQFWLGSSYYAVKDFPAAIAAQQSLIERFPDSPRIPDALLNIAASQSELNDRKNARATLTRITKDYPSSDAAKLAGERLASMSTSKDKK